MYYNPFGKVVWYFIKLDCFEIGQCSDAPQPAGLPCLSSGQKKSEVMATWDIFSPRRWRVRPARFPCGMLACWQCVIEEEKGSQGKKLLNLRSQIDGHATIYIMVVPAIGSG